MNKQKKVAAVGFCCADVYENLNEWYPTGNGVDFGIHLARAGVPVSVVSVVGNDEYGEQMKAVLEKEGIAFKKNGCVDLKKHIWAEILPII